jgi:small subunit ribosomal protein S16
MGRRHRPAYRLTAVDKHRSPSSRVLEELGSFDPLNPDPAKSVVLRSERIQYWLSVGATPSDTVRALLKKHGVSGDASK